PVAVSDQEEQAAGRIARRLGADREVEVPIPIEVRGGELSDGSGDPVRRELAEASAPVSQKDRDRSSFPGGQQEVWMPVPVEVRRRDSGGTVRQIDGPRRLPGQDRPNRAFVGDAVRIAVAARAGGGGGT